ncbi:hypothetical protein DY000_02022443 [Brassica cretica]|uniref:Uncharacterized protein n=1 Tax=Brassica cretica TaxID=69181 RepID=A0ABQ7EJ75_BRACR|nr:hypothetical protein DY000_02022443 [Brassica cretica]
MSSDGFSDETNRSLHQRSSVLDDLLVVASLSVISGSTFIITHSIPLITCGTPPETIDTNSLSRLYLQEEHIFSYMSAAPPGIKFTSPRLRMPKRFDKDPADISVLLAMTTYGHQCPIVRLPVERLMTRCSDLSYARTRLPVLLIPFVSCLIGILSPRFLSFKWMAERR